MTIVSTVIESNATIAINFMFTHVTKGGSGEKAIYSAVTNKTRLRLLTRIDGDSDLFSHIPGGAAVITIYFPCFEWRRRGRNLFAIPWEDC